MDVIQNMVGWMFRNLTDILLIIVGTSALIVYRLQKRNEIKSAATLVLDQIDSIEKTILKLKETNAYTDERIDDDAIYLSNEIDYAGAWSRYQYLLTKRITHSERKLLQDFFQSAYQVEKARADIIGSFKATWQNKSLVLNMIVGKFHDPTYVIEPDKLEERNKLIAKYIDNNRLSSSFSPDIAYKLLRAELKNFSKISGSGPYNKLEKLSYRKN